MVVPPQAVIEGSLAGYCTCASPSGTLHCDPVSPVATSTVIPCSAASSNAASTALISAREIPLRWKVSSSSPSAMYQLMDRTDGVGSPGPGCTALLSASTHPT